jgi:hypothetical protein
MAVLALFAASAGSALGQNGGPALPPSVNLPDNVESSLLKGLNASGTALRPGMGWLVSDLAQQGVHGQHLADVIHQLKPYRQRGVLTFPQVTQQGPTGLGNPSHGGLTRPPLNGGTISSGSFSGSGGGSFGGTHGKKK